MQAEPRGQAIDRMVGEAKKLKVGGIVGVRFTRSAVTQGAEELLACGTAVRLRRR